MVGLFLGWRWPESATDVWDDGREERVLVLVRNEVVSDLGLRLRAGDVGDLTGVLLLPPLPVGLLLCEAGDGEL